MKEELIMFYGVLCREDFEYIIMEGATPQGLFENYNCEAVFNSLENAEAYKNWLE